jgi:curved DNA-binding protein CbpA
VPLDPIPEFDLYAELGISPDADARAVERAWRAGVRSVHPDRASGADERAATTRTARLNIAREWLMDPAKRTRYDLLRRPGPAIDIPNIDPLGAWPVRPRARRPYWLTTMMRVIVAGLAMIAVALALGVGSGAGTVFLFTLGMAAVLFFGTWTLVWVVVGFVYRRWNN